MIRRDASDKSRYDVVVVGSGPNGLATALTCARAGYSVLVLEQAETAGGGVRSAALTLPGFVHDVCSAFYPLGIASPFFQDLSLAEHGLHWIHPPLPLAHPFEDGTAAVLDPSIEKTAARLGPDAAAYGNLMAPLVAHWRELVEDALAPLHIPAHPALLARFGWRGLRSAQGIADGMFKGRDARALFGGLAAHSTQPLDKLVTGAYGLILGLLGHAVGWPIVQGGSQKLADALVSLLRASGGEIQTGRWIQDFDELPAARAVFLDLTPRQALRIVGRRWPKSYRNRLERFRYGPGVFKMDWALDAPIPWRAPECRQAGTVHVGGTFEEIARSEAAIGRDEVPEHPFTLVGQQSLFDASRAPAGRHTAWAYCHVPNGCQTDMGARIEAQIERFAPGFLNHILARSSLGPASMEQYNPNYVGGDISGGALNWDQLFSRPVLRWSPYATACPGVYFCSSSTPPGGGVHGMCGYHAARAALAWLERGLE